MKWSAASNKNKKIKSFIVSLFTLIAFFTFSSYLLAQTNESSPLNLEEDLEIFNEAPVTENTQENSETSQNNNDENEEESFEPGSVEIVEEDELAGVEDDALREDEEIGDNQQENSLIDSEFNSDILIDNEIQEEVDEEEEIAGGDESSEEEPTENIVSSDDEDEEATAETSEAEPNETDEDAISDNDEETIAEADDGQEDIDLIEDTTSDNDESEEATAQAEEEDDTQITEDIASSDDESGEETAEIDETEQEALAGVEDDILAEEEEQLENTQQAESLINNEFNTENENVLSQTLVQAEDLGLSASFIRLPFEESKEERLARLQQDDYFDELMHISQTGVHQYKVTASRNIGSVGLNVGFFPAPSLSVENLTYEDIYGNSSNIAVFLNYEWKIFKKTGALSLVPEIGLSWANGTGRFASDSPYANETPKEKYTLFVIPVGVGVMYRLQYWKNQILTPFAIGGGSYFLLLETRDDFDISAPKESLATAATPAIYVGGGVQFSLGSLSTKAINTLDREFGINQIYLVAELRQYIGLSENLNFSGFVVSGGIRVDF